MGNDAGLIIREAGRADAAAIAAVYASAFPAGEAGAVGAVANRLLEAGAAGGIDSLVAERSGAVVGHAAFSPIAVGGAAVGAILCPLAVRADRQRGGVGSALVRHGIGSLAERGAALVLVYGDPAYYGRFGFGSAVAEAVVPPHPLSQPAGWLGLRLGADEQAMAGALRVVAALDDPAIW